MQRGERDAAATQDVTTAAPATRRGRNALAAVAMVAVVALSLIVRLHCRERAASYDEIWSFAIAAGRGTPFDDFVADQLYEPARSQVALADAAPAGSIWTHMVDRHPPLYALTLRWWRELFGESFAVGQAYSLAWSCAFAAFAFATARRTMGTAVATLLGVALATSPTQVYLAQEVRNYEMMIALGAAALWLMTRIELSGLTRGRAIALALAPMALLLTHYFALGAAVAIVIFGWQRLIGHRRAFFATLAASAAAYALAWLPFALRQVVGVQYDEYVRPGETGVVTEALLTATLPYRLLVDRKIVDVPLSALAGVLFILPWFLTRRLPALRPWALWLACSAGAVVALDLTRSTMHLGIVRYASVAAPAVLPLAAGCAYAVRRWLAVAVAGVLAVISTYELRAGTWITNECPPLGLATRFVAERAMPDEALLVFTGSAGPSYGQLMMLQASGEPGLFPRTAMTISRPVPPDVARRLPGRAWLIAPPFEGPIDGLIPAARILWSRDVLPFVRVNYIEIPGAATQPSAP